MRLDGELTCRDVVELVTAYLENALPPDERKRFETHLAGCAGCRNYLDQVRRTIETTGRARFELPPGLEEKLFDAFRSWRRT
jgi:anti-sigma factor RsiW